jgi:HD-GYP domain-containing protein (c-di-GMP phosphodiesterase class II)
MAHGITTEPDADLGVLRRIVASRERLHARLLERELRVELTSMVVFLAVATFTAAYYEVPRSLDPALALAMVVAYAIATRAEFQVGTTWTDASQLVFVPMLFVLPTQAVPLLVAAAMILSRTPEYARGGVHSVRIVSRVADSSYSIFPVTVLLAFDATTPEWSDWPVYGAALGAQIVVDGLLSSLRVSLGTGDRLVDVLREARAVYLPDVLLSPVGLAVAIAAAREPWAVLVVLPAVVLLAVFGRERQARIESANALGHAYRGTAHLLGEVLSTTHEYTGQHSRSVVVLAHQVGLELGVGDQGLREIEFGALLHDVGKIAVPNDILNKPGGLDEAEWEVMRRHTVEGERMLDQIGGVLGDVGPVIRAHHERFDGSGYPDGAAGKAIPLAARIIAACDAFNAMTTDRPYARARPVDEAIAELRACAGTQFDPDVVEAVVEVVDAWGAAEPPGDD